MVIKKYKKNIFYESKEDVYKEGVMFFFCEGFGKKVSRCPKDYIYDGEDRSKPKGDLCFVGCGWCQLTEKEIKENRSGVKDYVPLCNLGFSENTLDGMIETSKSKLSIAKEAKFWLDENEEALSTKDYTPLKILIYPKRTDKLIPGEDIRTNHFNCCYDSTNHFWFECANCKVKSPTIKVERSDHYANMPTIYFYLKCPSCGGTGIRKIYLEDKRNKDLITK